MTIELPYKNISLNDLIGEEWRPVPEWEEFYLVSNFGRFKSLKRKQGVGRGNYARRQKIKVQPNRKGYLQIQFHKEGYNEIHASHRIIAKVFLPNPYSLPEVNHKFGVKDDNRVTEIEWCTKSQNERDDWVKGRKKINSTVVKKGMIGEKSLNHKKIDQLTMDGEYISSYNGGLEAERALGINYKAINKALRGKSKSSGGFKWKYSKN